MPCRTIKRTPLRCSLKTADVMHLQTQWVPDAVREKHAGKPGGDRGLRRAANDAGLTQKLRQAQVSIEVYFRIVLAWHYLGAQRQFQFFHRQNQVSKRSGRRGSGAGDVAGITPALRARVDQHGQMRRWEVRGEVRVMQDGTAFVESDDVRVGQLLFAVTRGREIRQVDGIFALAGAERCYGRPVCQCAFVARNAHAGYFVRGLGQSAVVHPV